METMKKYKYTSKEVKNLDAILHILSMAKIGDIISKGELYRCLDIDRLDIDEAIKILHKEGLVNNGIDNIISINSDGRRFHKNGGFASELGLFEEEMKKAKKEAKLNNSVARSTLINNYVSIAGKTISAISILYTGVDLILNSVIRQGVYKILIKWFIG